MDYEIIHTFSSVIAVLPRSGGKEYHKTLGSTLGLVVRMQLVTLAKGLKGKTEIARTTTY